MILAEIYDSRWNQVEFAEAALSQPAQVLVDQATARVADVEDEVRVGARLL